MEFDVTWRGVFTAAPFQVMNGAAVSAGHPVDVTNGPPAIVNMRGAVAVVAAGVSELSVAGARIGKMNVFEGGGGLEKYDVEYIGISIIVRSMDTGAASLPPPTRATAN